MKIRQSCFIIIDKIRPDKSLLATDELHIREDKADKTLKIKWGEYNLSAFFTRRSGRQTDKRGKKKNEEI